jgi:hypothetical protein
MAVVNIVQGDLQVTGSIRTGTYATSIPRSAITEDSLAAYPIDPRSWFVWDSGAALPNTSSSDDLGFYQGTWASATPMVRSYDVKNVGATALYARTFLTLPPEYIAGATVTLRFHAGMVTTVASASCTIDAVCYESNGEGGLGSDLVTTAAQSINSLTFADVDFQVDPTGLTAGDILDLRVHIAPSDTATVTAVIAAIGKASLLCDIRG